jgi:transposase
MIHNFFSLWRLTMTATHMQQSTSPTLTLHLAFELGWGEWKLAFSIGHGQAPRLRTMAARDMDRLLAEIGKAKQRFGLPEDAPIVSCYEAGRDGFWLHRFLQTRGIDNKVIDSASIEVNRRQRRAKSDWLDAAKLVSMLLRYQGGEKKVWRVVQVPDVCAEDGRQLHRELTELKGERTSHSNRIKGLLASQGLVLALVDHDFPLRLSALRLWDGSVVPAELQARLLREWQRWQFVDRQIKDVENDRRRRIRCEQTPQVAQVRQLLEMTGVGVNGAWLLVREVFAWRAIKNRRQLGGLAGLTPTPYQSGDSQRELGISKAGNCHLRTLMVELAWGWLRWQAGSDLSLWFHRRFGLGNKRTRKIGIVALARKLLIALWRYLEQGEIPTGAKLARWQSKVSGRESKEAENQHHAVPA